MHMFKETFRRRPKCPAPYKTTFARLFDRFIDSGSVHNYRKALCVSTWKGGICETTFDVVAKEIARRNWLTRECISHIGAHRRLQITTMHWYCIHEVLELKEPHYKTHLGYCQCFCSFNKKSGVNVLGTVCLSDENLLFCILHR
jgi:hypothetical protein